MCTNYHPHIKKQPEETFLCEEDHNMKAFWKQNNKYDFW